MTPNLLEQKLTEFKQFNNNTFPIKKKKNIIFFTKAKNGSRDEQTFKKE